MGWAGPMTSRQYYAWRDFLQDDMDRPGKLEWYLMQLTETLRCHALKDWENFDTSKRKIKFEPLGKVKKVLPRDPLTGIIDPYANETDEERELRYRKQMGFVQEIVAKAKENQW